MCLSISLYLSEIKVFIAKRKVKFLKKFIRSGNVFCQMFANLLLSINLDRDWYM